MKDNNNAQKIASNPYCSVWVEANAGTGKTKVLTDRILKIILAGGDISKILCITYTVNSANEMKNRLIEISRNWALLTHEKLKEELQKIYVEDERIVDDELVEKAGEIFDYVLENISSLKIKTCHSFCEEILKKFPMEASVSPHFKILNELQKKAFLKKICDEEFSSENKIIIDNVAFLSSVISLEDFEKLTADIINSYDKFIKVLGSKNIKNDLMKSLEIESEDEEFYKREFMNLSSVHAKSFESLEGFYLTQKGEIRKRGLNAEELIWAEKYLQYLDKVKSVRVLNLSLAVLNIADVILKKYALEKEKLGFLDFDDLVLKTLNLFSNNLISSWVLFKLDGGINHILLDEAQDTSPYLWEIIRAMVENFFVSAPVNERQLKSLFVVGDKKQSIYSFQGADVKSFEKYKGILQKSLKEIEFPFENIELGKSWRSSEVILNFVDLVFKGRQGFEVPHRNARELNGKVEIYPVLKKEEKSDFHILKNHFEVYDSDKSEKKLAEVIAVKIKNILESGELVNDGKICRKICPSDFLILVRKRSMFAFYLNKELKKLGIDYDGIDRFKLLDDMSCEDLINVARFALYPYDELVLAGVFKSPIIGGTEEELFKLCHGRGNENLWDVMLKCKHENIAKKVNILKCIYSKRFLDPYEFYCFILDEIGAREKLLKRLGLASLDAINFFLNTSLEFKNNNVNNLYSFIDFVIDSDPEIKREGEGNKQNGVKIMTVHGAKGLEGRHVFLVDTARVKSGKSDRIFFDGGLFFYKPNKDFENEKIKEICERREAAEYDEYLRLLYVALTRSASNLYIFADKKVDENSWYDLCCNALKGADFLEEKIPEGLKEYFDDNQNILKIENCNVEEFGEVIPNDKQIIDKNFVYPNLKKEIIPDVESKILKVDFFDDSIENGNVLHKIMQALPYVDDKVEFVKSKINLSDIDEDLKNIYAANIISICEKYPEFFVDNLVEQEIILKDEKLYRIDNLIVKDDEILVIDYKSDKNFLRENEYKKQLNEYKNALKLLYPDRQINTVIIWLFFNKVVYI